MFELVTRPVESRHQVEPVGGLLGELGGVRVELLGFRIDALLVQVSL